MGWIEETFRQATGITIGPQLDQTANDWANTNVHPENFTGTLTDLNALINTGSQDCATYVITQAPAYNKADAITACDAKIKQRYAAKLSELQGQQKAVQDSITSSIMANANSGSKMAVIAIIVLVLAILILLLYI